jgi:hypothetical protein
MKSIKLLSNVVRNIAISICTHSLLGMLKELRHCTMINCVVRGTIGSLDCSHSVSGNCPVVYEEKLQGKEENTTML